MSSREKTASGKRYGTQLFSTTTVSSIGALSQRITWRSSGTRQKRRAPQLYFGLLAALNDDVTKERVDNMPYVNIQITRGATREQKAQLVKDVTDSLVRVLGKKPEHTHVVIQEINEEDWGFSGLLTDEWKKLK